MKPEPFAWPHRAPLQTLLSSSMLLLLAVALATWFASQTPWLGIKLEEGTWQVAAVHPEGPLAGEMRQGDALVAIEAEDLSIPLNGVPQLNNPHALPRYDEYNAFIQFQDEIIRTLAAPSPTLVLADGRRVEVSPQPSRPVHSLPLEFWLLHVFGLTAALIGLSIWAFQPAKQEARLLALSGVGFFIATWQHSIWQARELALAGRLFDTLMRGNHLGLHLMLGALAILLAIYPQRLGKWTPIFILVGVAAIQLNENLQLWSWPLHSFYLPLLLYYLLGVALAVIQWRLAATSPLDRGALRWVFLSVLLAMGAGMAGYFLPLLFNLPTLVNITTMVGMAVLLYLGFALGVLRYRLFELERWWFLAWAWFFGGLAVVLMDLAVVYLFGLDPVPALGIAVFLVGWVYFPARQWVWRRLTASAEVRMEQHLPGFVQALYTEAEARLEQVWRDLLQQIFHPLALEPLTTPVEKTQLGDNGSRLKIPAFQADKNGLSLLYGQAGRRLFSRRDREIAEALVAIAGRIGSVRKAQEAGASRERVRIQRDLHDDVGGRLLTLVHGADDERQRDLARKALGALREVTNALDEEQRYTLEELIDRWRLDLDERLALANVRLEWRESGLNEYTRLTSRQYINLLRTLDEAVTNALKHATADVLRVTFRQEGHELHLLICNDGLDNDAQMKPTPGRGLHNMRTRLAEIDGELEALSTLDDGIPWFCVKASLPLRD